MEHLEELNLEEAAVKGRSKHEIYSILVTRGKYYMPPEPQATSDFIHDVMIGKKKVRSCFMTCLGFETERS